MATTLATRLTALDIILHRNLPEYPSWFRQESDLPDQYSLYTLYGSGPRKRLFRIIVGTDPGREQPGLILLRHRPEDAHTRYSIPWDVLLEEHFHLEASRDERLVRLSLDLENYAPDSALRIWRNGSL
jgi:hypothetical protein